MLVELYAQSDVGQKRKNNEDNFLLLDLTARHYWGGMQESQTPPLELQRVEDCRNGIVIVAADGLGGEVAGEVASRMAIETVCEVMANLTDEGQALGEHLCRAAVQASQNIQRQGREPGYHKLGATFTGAALKNGLVEVVQVGDSRAYLLRGKEFRQITKDQTLVQQLIDIGQLSETAAETHPYKHVLIQALGTEKGVNPATGRVHLRRGDVILLCSDGLSGLVSDEAIRDILQDSPTLAQACGRLVDTANANGGDDNITVVLARCLGEDLPVPDEARIALERLSHDGYDDTTTLHGMSDDQLAATVPSFPSDGPPLY